MISKIINYFFSYKDLNEFKEFVAEDINSSDCSDLDGVLIDFSHVFYKKWVFKNFLIRKNLTNKNVFGLFFQPELLWKSWKTSIAVRLAYFLGLANKQADVLSLNMLLVKLKPSEINIEKGVAINILENLDSKEDLVSFKYEGIKVGDLIYDTYLKWYRKPTVECIKGNEDLIYLMSLTLCLIKKYRLLIESKNIKEMYITHSVYIAFGVLARVGLDMGVKVFVTQNTRGLFLQELSTDHLVQTPRFEEYADQFNKLPTSIQSAGIIAAKQKLEARLSGSIDSSISYMKKSAYNQSLDTTFDLKEYFVGRPWVVVMLHCFFDSPHIYKSMLFPDFYEWLDFTLNFLEENEINVIVKRHPNAMQGNEKVVSVFEDKFKKANFISARVNNSDLLSKTQANLAISVYGTVGHEFAYQGVTVINAGDNPHSGFSFCVNPTNVEEYKKDILELSSGKREHEIVNEDILKFYFMNYINNKVGMNLEYNERVEILPLKSCAYKDLISSIAENRNDFYSSINETLNDIRNKS